MKLIKLLNQPYPDRDDLRSIIQTAVLSGLIIGLALLLLQPLGISNSPNLYWDCLGFGLIASVCVLIYNLANKYILKLDRESSTWVFWKWIVYILAMLVFIAFANAIYVNYMYGFEMSGRSIFNMLYGTILVGMIPTLIFGMIHLSRKLREFENVAQASTVSNRIQSDQAKVKNIILNDGQKKLSINPSEVLFVQSMQNYVHIHFTNGSGSTKQTIRNTLSAIEKTFAATNIIKTHRSYLVNLDAIETIEGNAQGLRLSLKDSDQIIPVSRKYVDRFRK